MRYYRYGSDYGPKEFPNYEAVITYLRAVGPRYGTRASMGSQIR